MKKNNMKYVFLINSFSLGKETADISKRISIVCKELNIDYVIEVNSLKYSTEDIINKYKDSENIIIALGGDGTINRALNSIVGTNNILGYIPCGTGNDFYKTNRELLDEGINEIDLVKINDKYFINTACFGIDADIANTDDIVHSSIIPKSQRYNVAILKHFLKYKARHMKVIINGKEYEDDYTTVVVCNGKYYGGGYKIGPHANVNDGLVDVYLVEKLPKIGMAKLILGMKKALNEKSDKVTMIRSDSLKIITDEEVVSNIDGDKLADKEFNIEVIQGGIKVYYDENLINKIKVRKK